MIGKPVQQVLRTSTNSNAYPTDVTKLVSLRFTFAVMLTQQSYYRPQKTYNVASVVKSYGQHAAVPQAVEHEGGHPGAAESNGAASEKDDEDVEQLSPSSAANSDLPPQLGENVSRLCHFYIAAFLYHYSWSPLKSSLCLRCRRLLHLLTLLTHLCSRIAAKGTFFFF